MIRSTTYNGVELTWLGHAAFKLKAEAVKPEAENGGRGVVIYTDPYQIKKGEAADLILVTHDHYDHCDPGSISVLKNAATVVVANGACADKLKPLLAAVRAVSAGVVLVEKGVAIKAVPAYNVDKEFHPREAGGLGFVVTIRGVRIYQAGDTDKIPEMGRLGPVDVALLPIGGTYTMDEGEAAAAVGLIRPKVVVPMHYHSAVMAGGDPEKFKNLVGGRAEVKVLE